MTLSLTASATAVAAFIQATFAGAGGAEPYVYSVNPDGAGGVIDSATGIYTAPSLVNKDPAKLYDTIAVTDDAAATATARILVGTPLHLLCEILQQELQLDSRQVYLWDQKINQPKDSVMYIAVSQLTAKVIGNNRRAVPTGGGMDAEQYITLRGMVTLDVISRSTEALLRKEEVLMALTSQYSIQQQDANSISISSVPTGFVNVSQIDGAAIPYRFQLTLGLFYAQPRVKPAQYFDSFDAPEVTIDDGSDE